jgi:hypothetical protein
MRVLEVVQDDTKGETLAIVIEAVCGVDVRTSSASSGVPRKIVRGSGIGIVEFLDDMVDERWRRLQESGIKGALRRIAETTRGRKLQLSFKVNFFTTF